eukprot:3895937-Rhodomonas_salina.3
MPPGMVNAPPGYPPIRRCSTALSAQLADSGEKCRVASVRATVDEAIGCGLAGGCGLDDVSARWRRMRSFPKLRPRGCRVGRLRQPQRAEGGPCRAVGCCGGMKTRTEAGCVGLVCGSKDALRWKASALCANLCVPVVNTLAQSRTFAPVSVDFYRYKPVTFWYTKPGHSFH